MNCLGIESTAHTFGIGIADSSGKVLSSVLEAHKPGEGQGIVPMEAARHHERVKYDVLKRALAEVSKKMEDIDVVAWSQGPGLPPCLAVGKKLALELAEKHGKPLVGVNHCVAHVEIGRLLTKAENPIVLYVSGGNTQVLSFNEGRYRCFGESMDVGVGNALDKFAREAGLGFPGGPVIEREAVKGKWVKLPYTVKGMDLSFSGIVTEALRKLESGYKIEDMCFSLQETVFSMLAEVTERALAHTGKKEVMLTGGVAANERLQEMLRVMCKERGAKFHAVPREFCSDNGAMIAWTGILAHNSGQRGGADIKPRWRTDEAEITWI